MEQIGQSIKCSDWTINYYLNTIINHKKATANKKYSIEIKRAWSRSQD